MPDDSVGHAVDGRAAAPTSSTGSVLVGAVVFVKADLGVIAPPGAMPGSELDIALIAGLVALALLGPGRFSVDAAAGIEPDRSVVVV